LTRVERSSGDTLESVVDDLETRLAARAKRDGVEFRVERRPDGMWDVGFWSRVGIPAGIGPEGMMLVGAEATTREHAVAELAALLDAEDEEGTT
jgi:hypothetical protein